MERINGTSRDSIFFYDGECGFCDKTVMFLLDHTTEQDLSFSQLQSAFAVTLFEKESLPKPDFKTAYLWDNGNIYQESTAILRSLKKTHFPYRIAGLLLIIPSFIRNSVYKTVSRHRKGIISFGSCRILSKLERRRFIE